MPVRLIASDLDGTLFGPDSVPEPRTVNAINAAVQAGIVFAAVTGRSYFGGTERVTRTGATAHWFIGSNGGHRIDMSTGALQERLLFSGTDVDTMVNDVSAQLPDIGFGFEHAEGFTYSSGFHKVYPHAFDGGPRTNSAEWAVDDIGKIFVTHPGMTNDEIIAATTPTVPAGTHVSTSGGSFVEFTPAGATKGLALARLCDQLGIHPSEVIAFGDNNNDLSMLEWAGRGIAMANATPDAHAAADEVTSSNLDFGVAVAIEKLLGLKASEIAPDVG